MCRIFTAHLLISEVIKMNNKLSLYFCMICLVFGSVLSQNPVKVTVFYESLCPYSREFILNKLVPTCDRFGDTLILDLVPFGNAMDQQSHIACQRGPDECVGDLFQACMVDKAIHNSDMISWLECVTRRSALSTDWEGMSDCSPPDDWARIINCVYGQDGLRVQKTALKRAQAQHLVGVPTIFLDGVELKDDQDFYTEVARRVGVSSLGYSHGYRYPIRYRPWFQSKTPKSWAGLSLSIL